MSDDLIERLAGLGESMTTLKLIGDLQDRIEAQAAEIERLREALREVFEHWAGSEGFIPETAPEGYLLQLTKRMADTAADALAGKAEQ